MAAPRVAAPETPKPTPSSRGVVAVMRAGADSVESTRVTGSISRRSPFSVSSVRSLGWALTVTPSERVIPAPTDPVRSGSDSQRGAKKTVA